MKSRHNLHLATDLSRSLEQLAGSKGFNKSAIVEDALRAYLANRGARELDVLIKPRLDRLSRQIELVRRDLQVTIETLALFIQHEFVLEAQHAEDDPAMRAIGNERFETFINTVARRVGAGRSFVRVLDAHISRKEAAE